MTKEEIFEILMNTEYKDIDLLAEELKKIISYELIKKPEHSLVMFRMQENVENLIFNVGEILVTVCEVKVFDSIGYAMILDTDFKKAENRAFLMAIYLSENEIKEKVTSLAIKIKEFILKDLEKEKEIINSTRVNFELMGGQDTNVSHNKIEG